MACSGELRILLAEKCQLPVSPVACRTLLGIVVFYILLCQIDSAVAYPITSGIYQCCCQDYLSISMSEHNV